MPYFDMSKLFVPDPLLDIESMPVEEMVTLHAKLLFELPYLPEGTLIVRHRGLRAYYSVQTTMAHVRRDRYLSLKRDASLIGLLKQKKLIRSALTRIRKASRRFKGYRRRLAAKYAVIGRRHAEQYVYYTNKIYVCSTAEAAIVEMLHKHRVRFEYAPPTQIGGWIIHPDFKYTVDGRTVYHEHLGRLDDPGYVEDWHRKQERYRYSGLKEGTDLLISVAHGKRIDLVEIEQMLHARGVF